MMQPVCYNCFRYIPDGKPCPFCGYDPRPDEGLYRIALRPGTPLANRYMIGRVLGQGGFGVTYVALDSQIRARVAIKEYLPTEFVSRDGNGVSLLLNSQNQREDFEYGRQQFLEEARTLAEFVGSEHIVSIHNYFEANGTAYFAMEFVEGVNLKKYLERHGGPLPIHEANRILLPIMEALDWVHSKGIVHRDISPDNIMIRKDGDAKLIDFGAARYSTGEKSKSLDVVLKHGFAPMEQYSRRGRQGPYTDVYAMAATYYYAITGKAPADAADRFAGEELLPPSALGAEIRKDTEQVLMKALSMNVPDRYQRMSEFYSALLETMPQPFSPEAEEGAAEEKQKAAGKEGHSTQRGTKTGTPEDGTVGLTQGVDEITVLDNGRGKKPENASKPKKMPIVGIAVLLVAAILIGVVIGSGALKPKSPVQETSAPAETAAVPEETPVPEEPEATETAEPTGSGYSFDPIAPPSIEITAEVPPAETAPVSEPEPAPSEEDLRAINSGIEFPRADEYFDHYVYAVVRAPHGHSVLGFGTAKHDGNSYTVPDGEEVIILAERKGYSCCIVVSQQKARWINSEYLVPAD